MYRSEKSQKSWKSKVENLSERRLDGHSPLQLASDQVDWPKKENKLFVNHQNGPDPKSLRSRNSGSKSNSFQHLPGTPQWLSNVK